MFVAFVFLLWIIGANFLAATKNFYKLPDKSPTPFIKTSQLCICFAIYLLISLVLAPFLIKTLSYLIASSSLEVRLITLTALQLFIMLFIFLSLQLYLFIFDSPLYFQIWKNKEKKPKSFALMDFSLGVATWFLCFPIVVVIGDLIGFILKYYGVIEQDQIAVKVLKMALQNPFSAFFVILMVVALAPLIEEFLFRGVLQTYLKKRIGIKLAIIFSALIFALFHFALEQKLSNLTFLIPLFILGGFLGFLYEKQGSLWASLGLHCTFNIVSALRIFFSKELL